MNPETPNDDGIRLVIAGKTYEVDPDDLTLGEIEIIEDVCDESIQDIDFTRARALIALAYTLIHRENPAFTMEDARKMKVGALGEAEPEPEPEKPAGRKRPTPAAKRG